MRYPFVLFDAGETLLGPRRSFGATYGRVFRDLGVELDPGALDRAIAATAADLARRQPEGTDRFGAASGGEAGFWLDFVGAVLDLVPGIPPDPTLARRALDPLRDAFRDPGAWTVYPDVEPALTELRRRGVRLGIVSNWDSRLPALLERLGLRRHFETLAVSAIEGVEKPDPRLFQRALERLGAEAGRSLHVGDVPELDGAGARRAGIDVRLVDRHGRLEPRHAAWPDLSALPDLAS